MNDWKDKYIDILVEGFLDFLKDKTQAQKNLPISKRSTIVNDNPLKLPTKKAVDKPKDAFVNDKRTDAEMFNDTEKLKNQSPFKRPDTLDRITNPRKYAEPDNVSNAQDPSKRKGI